MEDARFGRIEPEGDGRWKISFVRRIERLIEKVWAALVIPERLADWIGDAEVELRVGGAYVIHFREGSERRGVAKRDLAGIGSGWHDFLDMIHDAADGLRTEYDVPRWERLRAAYEERLADLPGG